MVAAELRTIYLLVCPDWSSSEAAIAQAFKTVFSALSRGSAQQDITLLIDSRTLTFDKQESANLFVFQAGLELTFENENAVLESLEIELTGQLAPDAWQHLCSLISLRISLDIDDRQTIAQAEIAAIPVCELVDIEQADDHSEIYAAAQVNVWSRRGDYFAAQGAIQAAIAAYQQYLSARPNDASIYLKLGEAYIQNQQLPLAIQVLQHGIVQCPDARSLYFWLIIYLKQNHDYQAAKALAKLAADRFPDAAEFKYFSYLLLPDIYNTPEEIDQCRLQFEQGLDQLIQDLSLEHWSDQQSALRGIRSHTNFFLAYQAKNDRVLQQRYGDLVHQIMAANYPAWVQPRSLPPLHNQRIRLGYLSAFLCGWSGTALFLNWLKYADHQQFEIYAYHMGQQVDAATESFASYSTKFHHIPGQLEQVCQQVLADLLHVLIFPELGMDSTTLCIAGLRLAPIQCMAWGQPVTSGLPTIDYFLSSECMEPANGQDHYTEQLVRLPKVGISYPTIQVGAANCQRSTFGLRPDAIVYLSSQAPYKYLPQHDFIYPEIARQVPNAQFMFLRRGIPEARLERAFAAVGLRSQDYCVFSPVLPRPAYFDLLSLSDVYLDTFEWSGGNTTLDAIACSLPIVTCPGSLMRGRHSYGFLKAIGVTDTIAQDAADYIALAVRLAHDRAWSASIRQAIHRSAAILFDNPAATRELETFLKQAIAAKG